MLTLFGTRGRLCDGISRRSFPPVGGLAMGGLSLPALLRAEQDAGKRRSHKSVIMVYLSGGLASCSGTMRRYGYRRYCLHTRTVVYYTCAFFC